MIIGIHHGGVTVQDLDRAVEHLTMLSDWTVVHRLEADHPLVSGTGARAGALIVGPNAHLEVLEAGTEVPVRRRTVAEPGVTHLSLQLPDMAAKNRQLVELGIERHAEPVELGTGFSYLYVRDAEHNVVEIEGAGHAPENLTTWFSHVGMATPDVDRLRSTYEALLGAPAIASSRLSGIAAMDAVTALEDVDVTMTWVPAANANVELIQFHHPVTSAPEHRSVDTPGVGHLCLEVDDLAAEVAKGVEAGLTVVGATSATGDVEVARLVDPEGNVIEFASFHRKEDPLSLRNVESFMRYREMDALLADGSGQ